MRMIARTSLAALASVLLLVAVATAETTSPAAVRYRKVTGTVVTVSQTALVVKSTVKGTMTLALTEKTAMPAVKAKAGDRVRVNYRHDARGMTATKVQVLTSATRQPAAPASTASASRTVK